MFSPRFCLTGRRVSLSARPGKAVFRPDGKAPFSARPNRAIFLSDRTDAPFFRFDRSVFLFADPAAAPLWCRFFCVFPPSPCFLRFPFPCFGNPQVFPDFPSVVVPVSRKTGRVCRRPSVFSLTRVTVFRRSCPFFASAAAGGTGFERGFFAQGRGGFPAAESGNFQRKIPRKFSPEFPPDFPEFSLTFFRMCDIIG